MDDIITRLGRVVVGSPHPECKPDEMFVCYEELSRTTDMELPGKRFGTRAFDSSNVEVTDLASEAGIVPVFANREQNMARYSKRAA